MAPIKSILTCFTAFLLLMQSCECCAAATYTSSGSGAPAPAPATAYSDGTGASQLITGQTSAGTALAGTVGTSTSSSAVSRCNCQWRCLIHGANNGSAFNSTGSAFPVTIRACLMAIGRHVWNLGLTLIGHTITAGKHRSLCNSAYASGFAKSDAEGAAQRYLK